MFLSELQMKEIPRNIRCPIANNFTEACNLTVHMGKRPPLMKSFVQELGGGRKNFRGIFIAG